MSRSHPPGGFASSSSAAGPSSLPLAPSAPTDLWSDILRSADKKKVYGKKNLIVLSERHHGRTHLLAQLLGPPDTRRRKRPPTTLAIGYEVLQVREEGDEEAVPPLGVFYPPGSGSGRAGVGLMKAAVPVEAIPDTAVMVVLDWTRPGAMGRELMGWLKWIEEWAGDSTNSEEMRERPVQSHLQNYSEPPLPSTSSTALPPTSYSANAPLLPLGPGTLTLNPHGIPVIVVCTKADLMESAAEGSGMKGAAWEERCDWAQQVIRTICLSYGAALFYTASTQPTTYALLRSYLLHRLHSPSQLPSTSPESPVTSAPPVSRFPFPHRANVLDRDAVMVPSGWDTWGKINVLRDGFDPAGILGIATRELSTDEVTGETLENVWARMIPDSSRNKPNNTTGSSSTVEADQSFLLRQYDLLQKDPNRDPRAAFRQPPTTLPGSSAAPTDKYGGYGGVVGPLASSGGLSLPGVEKAMMEMEGQGAEDLKEKFAKLGRKEARAGVVSPTTPAGGDRPAGAGVPNEALHSFFQGLLASKGKAASPKAE